MAENDSNSCTTLVFNWDNIISNFSNRFGRVFSKNAKAHFDSLPSHWCNEDKVIDGARIKWCFPLLLDALIGLLEHTQFDLSTRRLFNQQKVLVECIWNELERMQPQLYSEWINLRSLLIEFRGSRSNCIVVDSPDISKFDITVENITSPWISLQELRNIMLNEPASKSHNKLILIMNALASHSILVTNYECDMNKILQKVIYKALFSFENFLPQEIEPSHRTRYDRKSKVNSTPMLDTEVDNASKISSKLQKKKKKNNKAPSSIHVNLSNIYHESMANIYRHKIDCAANKKETKTNLASQLDSESICTYQRIDDPLFDWFESDHDGTPCISPLFDQVPDCIGSSSTTFTSINRVSPSTYSIVEETAKDSDFSFWEAFDE